MISIFIHLRLNDKLNKLNICFYVKYDYTCALDISTMNFSSISRTNHTIRWMSWDNGLVLEITFTMTNRIIGICLNRSLEIKLIVIDSHILMNKMAQLVLNIRYKGSDKITIRLYTLICSIKYSRYTRRIVFTRWNTDSCAQSSIISKLFLWIISNGRIVIGLKSRFLALLLTLKLL